MAKSKVMMLGALPAGGWPGSGGPIPPPMQYGEMMPPWYLNFSAQPPPTPQFPQNPPRVTEKWMTPGYRASGGEPIYNVNGDHPATYESAGMSVGGTVQGLRNLGTLGATENGMTPGAMTAWRIAAIAGAGLGGYHGYKRHNSWGWAIGWSIAGSILPILVIPVAFAQGIGKRK